MACDLYVLHTWHVQVRLKLMPSFAIPSVICPIRPTQLLAFPFALSVHMLLRLAAVVLADSVDNFATFATG